MQARRTQAFGMPDPSGVKGPSSVWIKPAELDWEPDARSDYATVLAGWVSVTPLHTDWTNHAALDVVETLTVTTPAEVK